MRGAIPCLPVPLAWFCLVWNVLLPGSGKSCLDSLLHSASSRSLNFLNFRDIGNCSFEDITELKAKCRFQVPFGAVFSTCAQANQDSHQWLDWNRDSVRSWWIWWSGLANYSQFYSAWLDGAGVFGGVSLWSVWLVSNTNYRSRINWTVRVRFAMLKCTFFQGNTSDSRRPRQPATTQKLEEGREPLCPPGYRVKL